MPSLRPKYRRTRSPVGSCYAVERNAPPPGVARGGAPCRWILLGRRDRLQAREHLDRAHLPVAVPGRREDVLALVGRPVGPDDVAHLRPEPVVPERDDREILEEDLLELRGDRLLGGGVVDRGLVEAPGRGPRPSAFS